MKEIEESTQINGKISMSIVGKINIVKNVHTVILSNLQIQCSSYQNTTNDILHRNRKKSPKMYMEPQRARITKAMLSTINKAGVNHLLP